MTADRKTTMRAAVIDAPMDFSVKDVPMPQCPEGGMLVKVLACGLCGSDLRTLRSGHHRVKLPFTVGHEVCGRVEETGRNYESKWRVGDILSIAPVVYCGKCDFCALGRLELCEGYREIGQAWQGGFAEYLAMPRDVVEHGAIQRVPDSLDPAVASLAEPISSCVNAQEAGEIKSGEIVAVLGTGPIGCIHIALARAAGASKVIVADVNQSRLDLCAAFDPDHAVNASEVDLVDEMKRLTDGRGPDVVITANPSPESQVQAVDMARRGGRVLLFGGVPPEKSRPGIDTNRIHYNALRVIGTTIFAPRHQAEAIRLLAEEKIDGEKLITRRFPLEKFVEGANLALEGRALKCVFIP